VLPRLKVGGLDYWGDGWSWEKAVRAFCRETRAVMMPGRPVQCSADEGGKDR